MSIVTTAAAFALAFSGWTSCQSSGAPPTWCSDASSPAHERQHAHFHARLHNGKVLLVDPSQTDPEADAGANIDSRNKFLTGLWPRRERPFVPSEICLSSEATCYLCENAGPPQR